MGEYSIGQGVEVTTEFRDPDTMALVDPGMVRLIVTRAGVEIHDWVFGTDPEVVKDAVGQYSAVIDANANGMWFYWWFSEAPGQASEEGNFEVVTTRGSPHK